MSKLELYNIYTIHDIYINCIVIADKTDIVLIRMKGDSSVIQIPRKWILKFRSSDLDGKLLDNEIDEIENQINKKDEHISIENIELLDGYIDRKISTIPNIVCPSCENYIPFTKIVYLNDFWFDIYNCKKCNKSFKRHKSQIPSLDKQFSFCRSCGHIIDLKSVTINNQKQIKYTFKCYHCKVSHFKFPFKFPSNNSNKYLDILTICENVEKMAYNGKDIRIFDLYNNEKDEFIEGTLKFKWNETRKKYILKEDKIL